MSVDLVLSAAEVVEVAASDGVVGLLSSSPGGGVQLERPEHVGDVLEVGLDGGDLVVHVLNANLVVTCKVALDEVAGGVHGNVGIGGQVVEDDGVQLISVFLCGCVVDDLLDGQITLPSGL